MKDKIRHALLLLEAGHGYGGSSVFLYDLVTQLNYDKFKPIIVFYSYYEETLIRKMRERGIQVVGLRRTESQREYDERKPSRLRNYFKSAIELFRENLPEVAVLSRISRENKVELVILNNDLQYHVSGVLAAKLSNLPCICRKAAVGDGRKLKKLLSPWVALFIAISGATAQNYLEDDFPQEKLITIHEGVDLKRYLNPKNAGEVRQKLGISPSAVVIGSIGRVTLTKGQFDLLETASMVVKHRPQAMFLVVGDDKETKGLLLKKLKEKALGLGLDQQVIFTGWRDDIPYILSAIDIFVQNPTYPEGLGIATLEAMAAGKPTVVTNMGGLCDTTINEVTGLVVPPGDTKALSDAIIRLLDDRNLASQMGKRARLRAEEKFDIEKNAKKMEQVFLQLIGN